MMTKNKTHPLIATSFLVATVLAAPLTHAEVRLASPFTDHMVLQRELPVPVFGTADAGEEVTVTFAGQTKTATADADGNWQVDLDSLVASAEGRSMGITGSATAVPINLSDVLVGEVWLGSGQSNMEFSVSKSRFRWAGVNNEEEEIAAANYPLIRIFTGPASTAYEPQDQIEGSWKICTPENVPNFSAIGYFFSRELQAEIDVPVGFITVAYGASCAHAWVRREVAESTSEFKAVLDRFDEQVRAYVPPSKEEMATWREAAQKARAAGERPPRRPARDPASDQHNVTVCYNAMIHPVVPYAIRGVLWYQGESITQPKELFPKWNAALVQDWRERWGRELPFYAVQLAALDNNRNSPQVREWQAAILDLPATGMAVTIDIGDEKDVHPHNKQDVGDRLTRIALANVYGRDIEYSGPQYESMSVEDGAARLTFSHVAGGLVAKDGPLQTFEIAGPDGEFIAADARIDGETIVVSSSGVSNPTAVRYAWSNYPLGCNLYSAAGLPAAPFRTGTGQ